MFTTRSSAGDAIVTSNERLKHAGFGLFRFKFGCFRDHKIGIRPKMFVTSPRGRTPLSPAT